MICPYCKNTKQVLLFSHYVECLDCKQQSNVFIKVGNSENEIIKINLKNCRLLVTGKTGCGKTFLIKKFIQNVLEANEANEEQYKILLVSNDGEYSTEFDNSPNIKKAFTLSNLLEDDCFTNNFLHIGLDGMYPHDMYKIGKEVNLQIINKLKLLKDNTNLLYICDSLLPTTNRNGYDYDFKNSLDVLFKSARQTDKLSIACSVQRFSHLHSDFHSYVNNCLLGCVIADNISIYKNHLALGSLKLKELTNLNRQFIIHGKNFSVDCIETDQLIKIDA